MADRIRELLDDFSEQEKVKIEPRIAHVFSELSKMTLCAARIIEMVDAVEEHGQGHGMMAVMDHIKHGLDGVVPPVPRRGSIFDSCPVCVIEGTQGKDDVPCDHGDYQRVASVVIAMLGLHHKPGEKSLEDFISSKLVEAM